MSKTSIRTAALPDFLGALPAELKIDYLSLDCFDTLIWRNTHAPYDLFADLPVAGGALFPRRHAESNARLNAPHRQRRFEVTLDEIHAELLPHQGEAERAAMVQAELDAEARHCFAFAPTRDLIVDAKRRGLKVVIVSDTYLSEPRLRNLIAEVAGEELAGMIDRIFCSCEYGIGKAGGLFKLVLKELGIKPQQMVHLGDNLVADMQAPRTLGIPSMHITQFDTSATQRLRMEAAAVSMIDPATRISVPVYQPHRAQVSLRTIDDPTFAFGHDVLGPLMHGFASWIREEAEALEQATGRRAKLLFLQRDGHLPARAFTTLYPKWADRVAEPAISRVIAVAASFVDKDAIRKHMAPWLSPNIEKTLTKARICARQLLFDERETEKLLEGGELEGFGARVMKPANIEKILRRSAKMGERLFSHLRNLGVEQGDAVMLVDLGYNGSVQNAVEARLRTGMDLDVAGRYLLLREVLPSGLDKRGYFDTRNYDYNVLSAIFSSIAVVEQFCTMAIGSAVDIAEDGTPIREAAGVENAQSEVREVAQSACVAFLSGVGTAFVRAPRSDDSETRRRSAMGVLARLLMMPIDQEVQMLQHFNHDANFGVADMIQMSDLESAQHSIKRRGFFYVRNAERMYLPGELQQFGLPLNLSIFSMRRFNLDFAKGDVDIETLQLPIQVYGGGQSTARTVGAHRTADGYYRAIVPIGTGQFSIGLFLGRLFEYVQVEEISVQPLTSVTGEDTTPAQVVTDGMEEVAPGLYRIDGPQGFMVVPAVPAEEQMLLSVVLRPIVSRQQGAAEANRKAA
ncbi:HAD family hydrolase [Novosphingobium sp. BL-8H]|uniref:HAD family hydrolase n=1 Tax=Novosphingobium sp. BL-8H TaxID=3127640 RepID=UPI003756CCF2